MFTEKYELFDERAVNVGIPCNRYSCIYAPRATAIAGVAADIIFCGDATKLDIACQDVRRGRWVFKDGVIRSRTDKAFEYIPETDPNSQIANVLVEAGALLKEIRGR
ncbi:MAG: hypothetical protein LBJ73_00740 [Rickettsiales bacterium]|jgi:hypothetical protein|nr:hypothetical protein [Rickettsiales bacterium]